MLKNLKSLFAFLMAIPVAGNIAAQTIQRCNYSVYTRQNGMQDQIIKDFAEDSNGFIWMLGDNSLQWFDGSRFHEVPYGNGIHQIPGTLFLELHKTAENEIWIFYKKGFSVYNEATHSFRHYTTLIPVYKNLAIQPLVESDKDFIIENGTSEFYINKRTKQIVKQKPLAVKRIQDGYAALNNLQNPQIGYSKNYTIKHNYTTGKTDTLFYLHNNQPLKPFILNEKQLLGFDDAKVNLYENFRVTKTIIYPNNKKLISYQRPVNIIHKNHSTALVILDDELWEFDLIKLRFTIKLVNLEGKHFFNNGYFKNVFYDLKGNLWAGSNLQGLFKINTTSLPIQLIKSNIEKDNFVKCFAVNNGTNKIIAGTYGSGLQVYDTSGNHLKSILINTAGLPSANIISTIGKIDEDNYLVFVFNNTTQFILNTKTLTLKAVKNNFDNYAGTDKFQPNYYNELTALGNNSFYYTRAVSAFYF